MKINNAADIPAEWGNFTLLRKNQIVTVREVAAGGEQFVKSWGTLDAVPDVDFIIQVAGEDQYPIKKEEFAATYVAAEDGFVKKALTKVVKIPEGVRAELASKEGVEVISQDAKIRLQVLPRRRLVGVDDRRV